MRKRGATKKILRGERRSRRQVLTSVILIAAVVSGFIVYSGISRSDGQSVSFKAAIVDQLADNGENPSFVANVTSNLQSAGYAVDYYGPSQVTVEFFKNLPAQGYGVVIIRAHSTGWVPGHEITIFTSEHYTPSKYVWEQLSNQLQQARLPDNQTYFTITPFYVTQVMNGLFQNSIIIMMGCTGLKNSEMAQAFVARGARVYVSWDRSVLGTETDTATATLVQSLVQGENISGAINATMKAVGPDPVYGSRMGYYPLSQGGLALPIRRSATAMILQPPTTPTVPRLLWRWKIRSLV